MFLGSNYADVESLLFLTIGYSMLITVTTYNLFMIGIDVSFFHPANVLFSLSNSNNSLFTLRKLNVNNQSI